MSEGCECRVLSLRSPTQVAQILVSSYNVIIYIHNMYIIYIYTYTHIHIHIHIHIYIYIIYIHIHIYIILSEVMLFGNVTLGGNLTQT